MEQNDEPWSIKRYTEYKILSNTKPTTKSKEFISIVLLLKWYEHHLIKNPYKTNGTIPTRIYSIKHSRDDSAAHIGKTGIKQTIISIYVSFHWNVYVWTNRFNKCIVKITYIVLSYLLVMKRCVYWFHVRCLTTIELYLSYTYIETKLTNNTSCS